MVVDTFFKRTKMGSIDEQQVTTALVALQGLQTRNYEHQQ